MGIFIKVRRFTFVISGTDGGGLIDYLAGHGCVTVAEVRGGVGGFRLADMKKAENLQCIRCSDAEIIITGPLWMY